MSNYQNKTKEELIIEIEKLLQLNNFLDSSKNKKEKKHDKEEQKLQKKDLQFRKFSVNVPDLIFQFTRRTDGSYCVPIASDGIKNIFGCSPEDVLNDFTPIARVIYPEDAERVMNEIEYSAKHLTYFTCEYRVQLPGKEIQWILSKSTPEKLPDGSVTWYGFNANITEQKKAEEKLKKAAILLQSSIESPKDMIILSIDKNYNYLYFNECHRITMLNAYGQEVKIGMNLLECITSEEDRIKAKINFEKALNGESHITIQEYGVIEKSYYETRYNPIFNAKNEIIGTTAFSADITARKNTEEQLIKSKEKAEESEARYRTLFENMNSGFVLFEVVENEQGIPIDLIIVAANEGFEKTTGLNLKDAAGMSLTKVLPGIEKDEADWIGTYSKVAHTGESNQFEQGSELLGYYYSISAFYAGPKQCAVTFQDITESKQAQELLREREYLLSSSQRAAHIGTWSWKVGDTKVYWSDETYRIYGLSPEMGAPSFEFFFEIIHPEDRSKMQEWPTLLIAGLHPPPIEFRVLHPDGIYRVIQTNGAVIETVDGVSTRIAGTAYDITERKQSEEKLKESESRYRKIYEDGANGMVMVGKDFKFLTANRSFCQMVGYQEEELQQLTFLDITHPDDKDKDIPQVKKMIAGKIDVFRTEKRYLNKNGQAIWAQLTLSTFYDSNGQFLYNLGMIINITEQRKAELKLVDSEERLRLTTEQADIAVWEYDFNTNLMARSSNHDRLYGLEWQTKWDINTFLNATHPEDREYSNTYIQNAVAPGGPDNYKFDFRVALSDNSIRWLSVSGRVIERNKSGQGIKIRGILTDITMQKNAELALWESESRFRRAIIGAPFPILIHTEDGQVVTINKPWTSLTGYEHSDIPTIADWTRKAYGDQMDLVLADIDNLFTLDGPKAEGEYTITTSSGDSRIWDFSSAPIGVLPDGRRLVISMAMDVTNRKNAELDLIRMSQIMKNSQEIAHLGSFEYVAATQTTIWSEEEYNIYGLDPNGPSPEYHVMLEKCIHPDDAKLLHDTFMTAIQNQDVYELEHRIVRPDGSVRWVYDKANPYFDEHGNLLRYVGATLDITERKQAEEKLRESEGKFRKIYEEGPFGMVLVNREFIFMMANRTFCEITGYTESELSKLTFRDITFFEDKDIGIESIKKLIKGEIPVFKSEKRYVRKDGRIIWMAITVTANFDKSGDFLFNLAIVEDISRRKLDDEKIKTLNERLQLLVETVQELSISTSMENIMATVRTSARKLVNAEGSTFILRDGDSCYYADEDTVSPLWKGQRFPLTNCISGWAMLNKQSVIIEDIYADDRIPIEAYKSTFVKSLAIAPIRLNNPLGAIGAYWGSNYFPSEIEIKLLNTLADAAAKAVENVQLIEGLELKISERTSQLQASNKELEAFSYSVSHDLRAPLRHINGFVDLLSNQFKDVLPEKASHYLETISGASSQMGTLIDELLKYSRTGQKEVSKAALDFNALLKDVLEELTPVTKGREIIWNIQELPKVFGDYHLLKLVWGNLLDNAIKYTRNQQTAKISISYKKDAKYFVFCVCDNGVGFDMKYAHKLFGVFQRLHSQTEFEGTGIGLANVQRIIHKHLGRVWAEAEPGKGAKFYFSLPINFDEV